MKKIVVRKALINDAKEIHRIINSFSRKGVMLSRSLLDIYEHIRGFRVAEKNKKVFGCIALHIFWEDLSEIRSLAVEKKHQHKGIGRELLSEAIKEAEFLKIKKVFCLTYNPSFFKKSGFKIISKDKLPHKIWADCIYCPKFPKCDETAMLLKTK